jgi:hypothetical protein
VRHEPCRCRIDIEHRPRDVRALRHRIGNFSFRTIKLTCNEDYFLADRSIQCHSDYVCLSESSGIHFTIVKRLQVPSFFAVGEPEGAYLRSTSLLPVCEVVLGLGELLRKVTNLLIVGPASMKFCSVPTRDRHYPAKIPLHIGGIPATYIV